MTYKYPFGYSGTPQGMGQMLTMDQLMTKATVYRLDSEYRRRLFGLMEAGAKVGVPLGIGTGWRVQPDPPPPGFAQPGNSNHESFPAGSNTPTAVAADMVPNVSWDWMEANCAAYGLRTFRKPSSWGYKGTSEPWHIQPVEIPASRNWRKDPWKLPKYVLPGDKPPPPIPPPVTTTGGPGMFFALWQNHWPYMVQRQGNGTYVKTPANGQDINLTGSGAFLILNDRAYDDWLQWEVPEVATLP
jgi:hypothetical protein